MVRYSINYRAVGSTKIWSKALHLAILFRLDIRTLLFLLQIFCGVLELGARLTKNQWHWSRTRCRRNSNRLVQIFQDICNVLNANAQANHICRASSINQLLFRHLGMRRTRGMNGKAAAIANIGHNSKSESMNFWPATFPSDDLIPNTTIGPPVPFKYFCAFLYWGLSGSPG